MMLEALKKYTNSWLTIYQASAIVFTLVHAIQNAHITINAFVAGLILMSVYRKNSTIWMPIIAHYLVNLQLFGWGDPFTEMVPQYSEI